MPDIGPPTFDDAPRNESIGEREQRYANNLALLQKLYGLDFTASERVEAARLFIQITSRLTDGEQKAAVEAIAAIVKWVVAMRAAIATT